jgi:2'-5' RNA ligase
MRLFAGIPLPGPQRRSIAGNIEELRRQLPGWRWLPGDSLHLTLCFYGEQPRMRVGEITSLLRRLASSHPPQPLISDRWGCFPNRRDPRVLWIGFARPGSAPLLAIAEALARKNGVSEPRPLIPHLTLARRKATGTPLPASLLQGLPAPGLRWSPDRLVLFESRLAADGPRYRRLSDVPWGRQQPANWNA